MAAKKSTVRKGKKTKVSRGIATKADISLKQKLEIVLSWECNGHVLEGQKLSRSQMAVRLEITEYQLEKLIEETGKNFTRMFESKESVRNNVFRIAGTFQHQIREDRARAIIHSDQLNALIGRLERELDEVMLMSEGSYTEAVRKRQKFASVTNALKNMYSQRAESIRMMNQTSLALKEYLSLFTHGNQNRLPGTNWNDTDASETERQSVTYIDAIRIIETRTAPVLPRQDSDCFDQGPRNPNQGFEELTEPKNDRKS